MLKNGSSCSTPSSRRTSSSTRKSVPQPLPFLSQSANEPYQTVSDIRSLTASIFGIAAGILGLESYMGFLFYFLGTSFVSMLLTTLLMNGKPTEYFRKTMDVWTSDVVG